MLRPALEAAVAVARNGERTAPAITAPGPLRRYLSFARLPDPALEVAKRVLDEDEAFRARVAASVDEGSVGRPGWLYLARPPGWEAELDALRKAAAARQIADREDRAEREALRRLAGAEAAAARAETAAVTAGAEAERLRGELERERATARAALAEVEQLRAELARALEERSAAIRRMKDAEATAAQRGADIRALRHEVRMAQAELSAAAAEPGSEGSRPEPSVEPASQPPALDHAALVVALSDAYQAVQQLTAAIGVASDLVVPAGDDPADAAATGDRGGSRRAGGGTRAHGPARARRRPVSLPPGILDDSLEAADFLVRVPNALLLVDGYNISHAQWYGLPLVEQRSRLLAACGELESRCGTDVEVVFDGAEDEGRAGTAGPRSGVRYRFTAAGQEADGVLLARIDQEPVDRPVIVATSDREVREGARQRGANVLGARQVLAALRR